MHIDWTQTLVGSDGAAESRLNTAGHAGLRLAPVVQAGKVVGLLFTVTLFGLAVALSPLRGKERSLFDALALSGLLVSHVIGFGLVLRHGERGLLGSAAAGVLIPLFAIALGVAPRVSAALVLIVAADLGLALLSCRMIKRDVVVAIASGVVLIGLIGIALAYPDAGAGAILLGALAPFVTMLALLGRRDKASTPAKPEAADINAALLIAAMRRLSGMQVVSDLVGTLESPAKGAPFALHVQADSGIGSSLVEQVMIADRPRLLQALSNAIHSGATSEAFTLRLGLHASDQGGPQPPRFAPYECSVAPAAGLTGRAIVTLLPVTQASAPARKPEIHPAQGEAELARAFHDAVSPFNAGLGYLEIISDPDLSPDDIVTFRSYAIDARKAVSEAHRNAVLMGRWLRLSASSDLKRQNLSPSSLIEDAIRGFNLADRDDVPAIVIAPAKAGSEASVCPDAARFAIQILLRSALIFETIPDRIELEANCVGSDLAIRVRICGSVEFPAMPDAFQSMIEKVASSFADIAFENDGPRQRSLILRNAVPARGTLTGPYEARLLSLPSRLAS